MDFKVSITTKILTIAPHTNFRLDQIPPFGACGGCPGGGIVFDGFWFPGVVPNGAGVPVVGVPILLSSSVVIVLQEV